MIDTGGHINQSLYDKIFDSYFKGQAITQVDYLVLTHADFDHIGDCLHILQHIKVKQLVMTNHSYHHPKMTEIVNYAKKHQIAIRLVSAGDVILLDDIKFVVVSPEKNNQNLDTNANSIVLCANISGYYFLFTGDAGIIEEQQYLKNLPHIDVLKAGHHGSHTSSGMTLLNKIQPRDVIISAGVNNRYHHPHQTTLARLFQFTNHIYSTQDLGMIRYHYLFGYWWIETKL